MLKFLIEKEFKQIVRNSFLPKMILAMPLMMMLVMPWAANQEVKNVRLSVVDNDYSAYSERLIQKTTSSGYFKLTDVSATHIEAMQSIESGKADIIFEIQDDFERNLNNEGTGRVMISANSVNGTKGSLGSSYLSSILIDYSGELREEYGGQSAGASAEVPSFGVIPQYKFNPHLDYKVFMVPALMVMLLTMLCGFLPSLNIVGEKEAGTIEQMNVTPVKKLMFVLAKLIPYWIIGFIVLSVCMGLAALIYGIYPVGSLLTIFLFSTIYILVVSGIGLVISNYSDTMQQAMFVMFFFMMILLLMSGLFTPTTSMPHWAQAITTVNPLKYFIQVMRLVYLKGSAFGEMIPQFFALCGFAAVLNAWAVFSYKKSS
ncbi:MAG: ABC transporter permease [Dysgonamonadaceae bacterium]|jgi:ABC-2 type transport system permease protein|nr:ABC transporter permease [Dysgonamonadaceae bacterium]